MMMMMQEELEGCDKYQPLLLKSPDLADDGDRDGGDVDATAGGAGGL